MEVHSPPELQAKFERAAALANSAPSEYLERLVEYYLDHDLLLRQTRAELDHADEQLASGQFAEYDETNIQELAERIKRRGLEKIDKRDNVS